MMALIWKGPAKIQIARDINMVYGWKKVME